jgi:aminoglycoside 3-N-acetyltransferase I
VSEEHVAIRRLGPDDVATMRALNAMFADAFEDPDHYAAAPPGDAYFVRQLANPDLIVLAAIDGAAVVGGLVGHLLPKLEQARSELYIYDLAVAESHRRRGIATALIAETQRIARDCGAWTVFVQADYGDELAVALYTKYGSREDVVHFDIAPAADPRD